MSAKNRYEIFMAGFAELFITDRDFQNDAALSGVDLFALPACDALNVLKRYLASFAAGGHTKARVEVQSDLRAFTEFFNADLQDIPKEPVLLAEKIRGLVDAYRYEELGKTLQQLPNEGKKILDEFALTKFAPIQTTNMGPYLNISYEEQKELVKKQQAIVNIEDFRLLSEMIGGFNPGRLIMITGETGFGKTNLGLALAMSAAKKEHVAYINMEMDIFDIAKRLIVSGTNTTYYEYNKAPNIDAKVHDLASSIRDRFQITNGRSMTLQSIEAWIRSMPETKFVFIDYDQKIDLPLDKYIPEWKAIQKAMIKIEDLAKELNFCALMFAQVNRDGDISSSHRATFTAHTVLSFESNDEHGPIIKAKKNRHGKKNQALIVHYDEKTSRIKEDSIVEIINKPKEEKKRTLKPLPRSPYVD